MSFTLKVFGDLRDEEASEGAGDSRRVGPFGFAAAQFIVNAINVVFQVIQIRRMIQFKQ